MTHIVSAMPAQATFGRDTAMFEGLLDFVAQLSVGLWGLVILTVVFRFVGIWMYRRGAARRSRVAALAAAAAVVPTVVPSTTAATATMDPLPATLAAKEAVPASLAAKDAVHSVRTDVAPNSAFDAAFDQGMQPAEQPAAVATSMKVPRRAFRHWRGEPRSAANLPALAANSTEQ